jgi:hypothetical protein
MEQDQILDRFKKEFEQFKQQYGLTLTYEQLEKELYMTDVIWDRKYVPRDISASIRGRIVDMLNSWYGYFHGLMLPNPQSIPMHMEAQFFDDATKTQVQSLMHKTMYYMKQSSVVGLSRNKEDEAKYIQDVFGFWEQELKPKLIELLGISSSKFLEESKQEPKNSKKSMY